MNKIILLFLFIHLFSNCMISNLYKREIASDGYKKYKDSSAEFDQEKKLFLGYEVKENVEGKKYLNIEDVLIKENGKNRVLKIEMNKNELEIKEVNKEIAPEEVIYLINDFPLFFSNDFLSNNQLNSDSKEKKIFLESIPIYLKNRITEKPIYLFFNICSYSLGVGCSIQSFLVKKNAKNDIIIIKKEEFRVSKFEINYVKRNRFYYYLTQSGYLITTPLDIVTFPLQTMIFALDGIIEIVQCTMNSKKKCFRGMIPG